MSVPAQTIVATKINDGVGAANQSVQLLFLINGAVRWAAAITGSDFTTLNTTVNGGSPGATVTLTYAEDAKIAALPIGTTVNY